jgi:hypothetical protein
MEPGMQVNNISAKQKTKTARKKTDAGLALLIVFFQLHLEWHCLKVLLQYKQKKTAKRGLSVASHVRQQSAIDPFPADKFIGENQRARFHSISPHIGHIGGWWLPMMPGLLWILLLKELAFFFALKWATNRLGRESARTALLMSEPLRAALICSPSLCAPLRL